MMLVLTTTRWDPPFRAVGVRDVRGADDCRFEHFCVKVFVIMARLTRLVMMLASGFGFAMAAPAQSQAGVIPWVYDAIFGPVGSLRAARGNSPTYAGYGYAPMSAGYAPTSSAMYGSYGSYGSACNSCSQTSQYVPSTGYDSYGSQAYYGSNGCNSCSSGNCSSGSNCSNCTPNSAPNTSGYGSTGVSGPTPDPNYNSRDLNHRLNELEHRLNEDEKFLKNKHNEDFAPRPYSPTTYGTNRDRSEIVPKRTDTFPSNPSDPRYDPHVAPRKSRSFPQDEVDEQGTRKPVINPPGDGDTNSSGLKEDGSQKIKEAEPLGLRLENRVTSRAIAPRERQQIVTNQTKIAIAKSNRKPVKNQSANPNVAELARQ